LPARARYELLPPNQLRLIGERVPSARLPEVIWQPLNRWIQPGVTTSALPGDIPSGVPLRLVRCSREQAPELLLTSTEIFLSYTQQAPRVRLERLQFAADERSRVLVRGTPLPPLPGQRYVLHGSVAVPVGFGWEPAISVEALARVFGISGDALVLWDEAGTYSRLHEEQFIPVTRSAVRATVKALAVTP
jgi:hypothetical protein